ncbi:unnamed protein product [Cladocopium goreaui]|uniref:Uncharacterized protein n=1 Tax=Cladocopium goreaui TaxID=2562237 RepID=A0A9P1CRU6_9DINO|nr:unnamed protein product [Cladocopium goreaui]
MFLQVGVMLPTELITSHVAILPLEREAISKLHLKGLILLNVRRKGESFTFTLGSFITEHCPDATTAEHCDSQETQCTGLMKLQTHGLMSSIQEHQLSVTPKLLPHLTHLGTLEHAFGFHCSAYAFGQHDKVFCVPLGWPALQTQYHVLFANEGIPDAWAFIVLGEKYDDQGDSILSLLGWSAHQVRYDPASPFFAGATRIGPHIAEREGLFFAALWRAQLNINIPTVFRSDSSLAIGQASGRIGAIEIDLSFSLLRGLFQFLEAALGPDLLLLEHIYGHNSDPWNEAVDAIAKQEAQQSFFLQRPDIDLRRWHQAIPFLWMLFGDHCGCPQFCGDGFNVCAPSLPPDAICVPESPAFTTTSSKFDFKISFASANVSTLGVGSKGHTGKLDYIKGQFVNFHLNFLGVQEARTQRATWWSELHRILQACHQDVPLVAMIDANAAPGDGDLRHVLGAGFAETSGTPFLRQFLETFGLFLPSTGPLHTGPRHTWTAPDGVSQHCIDYVAIPNSWLSRCVWSQCLEDFDLNVTHVDHIPVGLEVGWSDLILCSHDTKSDSGSKFDRNAIGSVDLAPFLSQSHDISWNTDIESHVDALNASFTGVLQQYCPKPQRSPKKPFIDDRCWALRTCKLRQRRIVRRTLNCIGRESLHRSFFAWRSLKSSCKPSSDPLLDLSFNYGTTLRCGGLRAIAQLWNTCRALKKQLQLAKKQCLADRIKESSSLTSASDILRILRPFVGSSNAKNKGPRPLPLVCDDNGLPCASSSAALNRWIDFFMAMEGGSRLDTHEQRRLWIQGLKEHTANHLDVNVAEIPSLVELEAAFRRVKKGKASGPDQLPSELFHQYPAVLARHCYSVLLKVALQGQECLIHKGGTLVPLWKGKGDQSICSSFRSILLSSHFGKSLHRALRLKQADVYEAYIHAQQLGGRRKTPVTLGAHQARAFLRYHKQQGRPTALLFLDLTEAFYRVVRPLALSGSLNDEVLAAMACRLQLDANVIRELHGLLRQPGAIEHAQLPEHAQRIGSTVDENRNALTDRLVPPMQAAGPQRDFQRQLQSVDAWPFLSTDVYQTAEHFQDLAHIEGACSEVRWPEEAFPVPCRSLKISQGHFGARTPKPTNLLSLNLPGLKEELNQHSVCDNLPKRAAIGRQHDGSWATSQLKEYPPALCFALASCFFHHIVKVPVAARTEPADHFLDLCQSLLVQSFSEHIGRDFAG